MVGLEEVFVMEWMNVFVMVGLGSKLKVELSYRTRRFAI